MAMPIDPEDNLNKAARSARSPRRARRGIRRWPTSTTSSLCPMRSRSKRPTPRSKSPRAELDAAQREFERAQKRPRPEALSLAQARIKNAEAQLAASQAALADLELNAPFSGTVSKVSAHSGEWVMPGQAILVLADLDHLRVETTDLSERDVPQVEVGQPAAVRVKALGVVLKGTVSEIAPLAGTLGGDVVYTTIIDLHNPPKALRAGMSVDVQFGE